MRGLDSVHLYPVVLIWHVCKAGKNPLLQSFITMSQASTFSQTVSFLRCNLDENRNIQVLSNVLGG